MKLKYFILALIVLSLSSCMLPRDPETIDSVETLINKSLGFK